MCVCVCVCVGVIELTYGTVQGYSRVATMAKKQGIEAGGLAMVGMEGVGGGGGESQGGCRSNKLEIITNWVPPYDAQPSEGAVRAAIELYLLP